MIGRQVGVPDEDLPRIKGWTDKWIKRMGLMQTDEEAEESVLAEIEAQHYFQPMFEQLRREPNDTLLSTLVNREIPEWGRPLNDNELHAEMMADLFVGGSETTTNALAAGVILLIEHPEVWQKLTSDPEKYLPTFCEEVLRVESPVQGLLREAAEDIELHGVEIPAGSVLMLRYAAGNRDERDVRVPGRHRPRAQATRGATSPSASAPITASAPRWRGASCSTASRRSSTWSRTCGSSRVRTTSRYHQNFFLLAVAHRRSVRTARIGVVLAMLLAPSVAVPTPAPTPSTTATSR